MWAFPMCVREQRCQLTESARRRVHLLSDVSMLVGMSVVIAVSSDELCGAQRTERGGRYVHV